MPDESGIDPKDTFRVKSRAEKGQRTTRFIRWRDQKRWSILPAVSEGGLLAASVMKGSVERVVTVFKLFVLCQDLLVLLLFL